jgi:hypothetical protein
MSESPYAQFGVHNAVITGDSIDDHRQAMLAMDVAARDGDDSIELVGNDTQVSQEEDEEGRFEIKINTEGTDDDEQLEVGDETDENEPAAIEGEFEVLPEPDAELVAAVTQIGEYSNGFAEMRAKAVTDGLPQDVAERIEQEYENDNELSKDSYEQLAKAGYSKGFVDSFIQGQEALAETYVAKIVQYAGGEAKFNAIVAHIKATNPDSLDTLYEAIERQDLKAIKSTINLATSGRQAKLGKPPARNVAAKAPASGAVRAQAPTVEKYKSADEMVAAMSDRRYQTDPKYRDSVRAKVALM